MKPLRRFFMEDYLENFRFDSAFNLGESGGRPQTAKNLLNLSGVPEELAAQTFLNTLLCDSPNRGRQDLRELVAHMHPGCTPANVLITTGTSEALFLLLRHLNPKSVALAMPAFQLLYEIPLSLGATIIPLPVRWNAHGHPYVDEHEWIQILETQKPECLLINHPHNPSGLVFSTEFLNTLSQTADKIQCQVIGDEHYRFLSSDDDIMGPTLWQNHPHRFVTGSFIKCLGCPGLRIGWCIGPAKDMDVLQNEKNYTTHTVNPFSEWISFEVLKDLNSPLWKNTRHEWLENKKILNAFLTQSASVIGCAPQGGLVTSIAFQQKNTTNQDFFQRLIASGVFLLPLSSMEFDTCTDPRPTDADFKNGFRLGLGTHPEKLKQALSSIRDVFDLRII